MQNVLDDNPRMCCGTATLSQNTAIYYLVVFVLPACFSGITPGYANSSVGLPVNHWALQVQDLFLQKY